MVVGLAWSLWSLRTLGASFSIAPQARKVGTAGPSRWVRHPLYLGELLSLFGVILNFPSIVSVVAWCLLVLGQAFRTIHEERAARDCERLLELPNSHGKARPGALLTYALGDDPLSSRLRAP